MVARSSPEPSASPGASGSLGPLARPAVASARRVVLKVGTRVLTHDDGRLALSRLFTLVEAAAALRRSGRDVIVVSSGALGLGREALGLGESPRELPARQACAAVGQSRLMGLYEQGFGRLGVVCAQVLLTEADFDDRGRYLNLRSAMLELLRRGVVPVVNENDVVATEELACEDGETRPVFGDNDKLSALVATKLDADLLVLLTDVAGVYDRDPRAHADARLLERVEGHGDSALAAALAGGAGSSASRGGMRSKVLAAVIAARAGCHAVVASGREPAALERVLAGEAAGTWFVAGEGLDARRRWIAFATAPRGTLHLDSGAVAALRGRGASLLARGVCRVDGDFDAGDTVALRGPDGQVVGRGVVHCDAAAARRWAQGEAPEGVRNHHALVHRDLLVLEETP
jgi:glutamate 5-kinase